jgi:hypothetical protein
MHRLCISLALWNGRDPILKEWLFGLTNNEGNHGEDVKEIYYYLDATRTASYPCEHKKKTGLVSPVSCSVGCDAVTSQRGACCRQGCVRPSFGPDLFGCNSSRQLKTQIRACDGRCGSASA